MKKLLVSLIVLAFAVAPVSANMVTDGGFENPHFEGEAAMTYTDGQTHGAWTMNAQYSTGIDIRYDTVGEAFWADIVFAEGTQMASIGESTRNNSVSQMVSGFTIGNTYTLSLASISYGDYPPNELLLTVGTDLDIAYSGMPVRDPSIRNDMGYSSHQFVASATDLLLTIENPYGAVMVIDDVSIVPEPATMCLLGLGGLLLRRKR